jgi:hypothetical protein
MKGKTQRYTGINVQYPISRLILSRVKSIETRTYPIPSNYIGKDLVLIETPGRTGQFRARAVAIIRFTNCFKYKSQREFYRDIKRHHVSRSSPWAWNEKPKWGWNVELVKLIEPPVELKRRPGIRYSKNISI